MSDGRTSSEASVPKSRGRRRLYQAQPESLVPAETTSQPASGGGLSVDSSPATGALRVEPLVVVGERKRPAELGVTRSTEGPVVSRGARRLRAGHIVQDHVLLAASAMAIPVPIPGALAEAALQVRMIRRLAALYQVEYEERHVRTLLGTVLSALSAGWFAGKLLRYASWATYVTNFWPAAMLTGGLTYGIGMFFVHHFESGGTLRDARPEQAVTYLRGVRAGHGA